MAKLGSEKRPVVIRVHTDEKARYVAETCAKNGWHYIIGFEPDKPEDISDLEKLLNPLSWLGHKKLVEMICVHAAAGRNSKNVVEPTILCRFLR